MLADLHSHCLWKFAEASGKNAFLHPSWTFFLRIHGHEISSNDRNQTFSHHETDLAGTKSVHSSIWKEKGQGIRARCLPVTSEGTGGKAFEHGHWQSFPGHVLVPKGLICSFCIHYFLTCFHVILALQFLHIFSFVLNMSKGFLIPFSYSKIFTTAAVITRSLLFLNYHQFDCFSHQVSLTFCVHL